MSSSPSYGGRPDEQPREWLDYLAKCERQATRMVDEEAAREKAEASRAKLVAMREARRRERWEAARQGKDAL